MSCRTISATMLPIKSHEVTIYEHEGYETAVDTEPKNEVTFKLDQTYSFLYCVAYRHPSLPEWIVARGFWNDDGIRTADDIWRDF